MNKEFKIIKILDRYSVVVNAGRNDVVEGDKLYVVDLNASKLYDPDTNEYLGKVDGIKASLLVEVLEDKFCICVNYHKGSFSSAILAAQKAIYGFGEDRPLPLNIDESQIDSKNSNAPIQVGDIVRKTF